MSSTVPAKNSEPYPPHILVVDDDTRLRSLLKKFLRDNGYMVSAAANAGEARRQMDALTFDLLVLDVMMPGEDGYALAKTIRTRSAVPILMLTAMGEATDRIKGLEIGVDDYMGKPFEPKELVLRIASILRRAPPPSQEISKTELKFGACRYDLVRKQLTQNGAPVHLTVAEGELLHTLAQNANEAIERSDLGVMETNGSSPRTIDVQMTRLRRKIEADPRQPRYLQTVRGTGYILRTDP